MRVLMTTMQLDIGGAETHIVELSKALSKMGVEVFVASNGGAYEAELKEAGIKHFHIPFHSKNPYYMQKAYRMLKKLICDYRFDIVHAHARIPAFLCALLKKSLNFRFVTTAHWVFSTRFPYNLLTRWGDRSLAVSDDIKKYLIDNYGIDGNNIRVTINGIDTEKFSKDTDFSGISAEFGLEENKTRIVYVSRMDTDRSLAAHKLIEAASDLYNEIPDLEIVIVGGGNDFDAVKAEADAVNRSLGRRLIITTGSRTDINRFVASGDLFIGVSRAALEAMACEKPAIIAGNEGYIGIFSPDKLGVSIDTNFCCRGCAPTVTEILKKDILTVLTASDEEKAALGSFSRETVKEYYSITTMAEDALKMYISVIAGTPINETDILSDEELNPLLLRNPLNLPQDDIDVMISGYYGFRNSGDDSILKAMTDTLLKKQPDLRILVLSNDPKETKALYNIDAIHRFNFPLIIWKMRKTRLLISGGGSLIQDVTSNKSLLYYLSIVRLGKMLGAKVMLYANGIGPVLRDVNHKKIRRVLNTVDLITLREPSSLEELSRFGVTDPDIRVTADPAFTLEPVSREETSALLDLSGMPKDKPYFVISLRPWSKADSDLELRIANIADEVHEKYGLEVLLVPMQVSRDTSIARRVKDLMHHKAYILKGIPSPVQILGIAGGAEFVMGMRLHTLIYAAKTGTPAIGITYDPKVDAMMDYLGQRFIESAKKINPLTLTRYIDEIMAEKENLKAELQEISASSCEKALENADLVLKLLDMKKTED